MEVPLFQTYCCFQGITSFISYNHLILSLAFCCSTNQIAFSNDKGMDKLIRVNCSNWLMHGWAIAYKFHLKKWCLLLCSSEDRNIPREIIRVALDNGIPHFIGSYLLILGYLGITPDIVLRLYFIDCRMYLLDLSGKFPVWSKCLLPSYNFVACWRPYEIAHVSQCYKYVQFIYTILSCNVSDWLSSKSLPTSSQSILIIERDFDELLILPTVLCKKHVR